MGSFVSTYACFFFFFHLNCISSLGALTIITILPHSRILDFFFSECFYSYLALKNSLSFFQAHPNGCLPCRASLHSLPVRICQLRFSHPALYLICQNSCIYMSAPNQTVNFWGTMNNVTISIYLLILVTEQCFGAGREQGH